jgi:hypothetical protein
MQSGCRIKLHFIPTYCPHLIRSSGYLRDA